jgi:2-keto-4-pentenoate hydratase/2-oxohepta-3-ene-1,7-dioic acid hydratase in catechol pathway
MVGDTERMDWFSGKAMQSTTPLGPYVVTPDEMVSPMDARITSRVNGRPMQDESTSLMIRSVADLVSFVSTRVELTPGDVVATGTPEGIGEFQDISLSDGDRVTIEIAGIGTLENVSENRQ